MTRTSEEDKRYKFQVPHCRVDWLWYKPEEPSDRQYDVSFARFFCTKCDIRWDQPSGLRTQPRCWCCGRFVRKPKAWSY